MSANTDRMRTARVLISEMSAIVDEYESEFVTGAAGIQYPLTQAQVNLQKQAFSSRRTALIAAVNAVTG